MRHLSRTWIAAFAGLFLLIPACDRSEERLQRAQDVTGAAVAQLMGGPGPDLKPNRLEKVSPESRAISGAMQDPMDLSETPRRPTRYVVGSIVAKPRNIQKAMRISEVRARPELARQVVVDDRASEGKIVVLDEQTRQRVTDDPRLLDQIEKAPVKSRSITVVDPDRQILEDRTLEEPVMLPRAPIRTPEATRDIASKDTALSDQQKVEALPVLNEKLQTRALAMNATTLDRQIIAEERMIQTATKYGLAASIQRSRTGQMVIEIGDEALNPTQFGGEQLRQQSFAYETDLSCDEEAARSARNTLIAMECVINDLRASGEFEYVEKDYVFELQLIRRPPDEPVQTVSVTPDDPLFELQWHYLNRGDGELTSDGGAGFVDFWTREGNQGSNEVVIAIVDTGIELSHPDIATSPNIAPGWDMVTDPATANDGDSRDANPDDPGDACPENLVFEDTFHGTHVAGTAGAGATNNGTGIAGAAWSATIVPVRALGKCGGRLSDINDSIRWAGGLIPEFDEFGNEVWNENPADIINLSIGLFRTCPASLQDAIDDVTDAGAVVVAAAGNDRVSTEFYAPAGCNNVITVAAGDARGYLTPYSNFGSAVDLIAPGGDLSRDDNGDGNPDGVLSSKTARSCFDPVTGESVETCYYAFEQGTSMAAPHVSAALALIKSARPDLSGDALRAVLLDGLGALPQENCLGDCTKFPGSEPLDDGSGQCLRPCGTGALDLTQTDLTP